MSLRRKRQPEPETVIIPREVYERVEMGLYMISLGYTEDVANRARGLRNLLRGVSGDAANPLIQASDADRWTTM